MGKIRYMKNTLHDDEYLTKWTDVYVKKRERYKTAVTDFHEHDFYEINLILSGNVKVLVSNQIVEGTECKIVLTKPDTSHFVICKPDMLYSSLFLMFSKDFIQSYDIQIINLLSVFGERGTVLTISPEEKNICRSIIESIDKEKSIVRKRLLVFYLLSYINDISRNRNSHTQTIPQPICDALDYITRHYMEKIVAQELADMVHIGRTTLMTQFKKYTGKTLHEYVTSCRLKNAVMLLLEGKTEYDAAISCGFSDSSSFIQCFKRVYNTTPKQYIKVQNLKNLSN